MLLWVLACAPERAPEQGVPAPRAAGSLPVWGGTLEVWGERSVLADPDGDRVLVVDHASGAVTAVTELEPDSAPFRVATDGSRAWITLRGSGQLAEIALDTGELLELEPICDEPRGIDLDESTGYLYVACADGALVQRRPDGRTRIPIAPDLREVLVTAHQIWVAPRDGGHIYELDRARPEEVDKHLLALDVVWRLKEHEDSWLALGTVQSMEPIEQRTEGGGGSTIPSYGTAATPCTGPVGATLVTSDGALHSFRSPPLLVDMAIDGDFIGMVSAARPQGGASSLVAVDDLESSCLTRALFPLQGSEGHAVALGFDDQDRVIVQMQQPLALLIDGRSVELGVDTWTPEAERQAFALFHEATGPDLSCASCHPEGQEDGHVWTFRRQDGTELARRTMPLAGALASRAPYHWLGDLPTLSDLMMDTFTEGMQGRVVGWEEQAGLLDWLDGVRTTRVGVQGPDASPGQLLFEDAAVGCAECHSGPAFTDNRLWDVRLFDGEGPTKTPSLLGVGSRRELMHDGCAETLEERFSGDLECTGGREHGRVDHLRPRELEQLVAYLRTL